MPLSSKVRDRCRTYLGTGERIQYLIPGMSLSINKMVAHVEFLVMVTDRHVTLLACSRWRKGRQYLLAGWQFSNSWNDVDFQGKHPGRDIHLGEYRRSRRRQVINTNGRSFTAVQCCHST